MQTTNVRNLLDLRGQKVIFFMGKGRTKIGELRLEKGDWRTKIGELRTGDVFQELETNNSRTKNPKLRTQEPTTYQLKTFFVLALLLTSLASFGQRKVRYQDNYDAKNLHFGFLIGVGQTNYGIKTNRTFLQPVNTKLDGIVSPPSYFLRLGGLMNVKLNDHFDFRILPTVSIYSRSLILSDTLRATTDLVSQRDKAWLELPIALKYKSERRGNIRMYMFGGFRYGKETNVINFISRVNTPNIIETKASDFSVEYGIGLEAFLRYFKLTPELHFSHGLANSLRPTVSNNTLNTNQLVERMNTHTVTLVFMFE